MQWQIGTLNLYNISFINISIVVIITIIRGKRFGWIKIGFWQNMIRTFLSLIFFISSLQMDSRVELPKGTNRKETLNVLETFVLDRINPILYIWKYPKNDKRSIHLPNPEYLILYFTLMTNCYSLLSIQERSCYRM